jgi:hypothetical protein
MRREARKIAKQPVPERQFTGLSILDKLRAYDLASPEERARYNLGSIILRSNLSRSPVFERLSPANKQDVLARVRAIGNDASTSGEQ